MNTITDRIEKTPEVCGGEACIRGHRLAVAGLVEARRVGFSDSLLLESYPGIEQADLDAACEYASVHKLEIERTIWLNIAAFEDQGGDERLAIIVRGWDLGMTEAEMDETVKMIEPPLTTDLNACRQEYLARKDEIDRALPRLLPAELREGLHIHGPAVCG